MHDPHHQKRVDRCSSQFDDEWAVMSEAECVEYHSKASSFDEAEEEMSTDGKDSEWGHDEHISKYFSPSRLGSHPFWYLPILQSECPIRFLL